MQAAGQAPPATPWHPYLAEAVRLHASNMRMHAHSRACVCVRLCVDVRMCVATCEDRTGHAVIAVAVEIAAEQQRRPLDWLVAGELVGDKRVDGVRGLRDDGGGHHGAHVRRLRMKEEMGVHNAQSGVTRIAACGHEHRDLTCRVDLPSRITVRRRATRVSWRAT